MPPRQRIAHKPKSPIEESPAKKAPINSETTDTTSFKPIYSRPFESRPKGLSEFLQKTVLRLQQISNRQRKPANRPKIFPIAGILRAKNGYQKQTSSERRTGQNNWSGPANDYRKQPKASPASATTSSSSDKVHTININTDSISFTNPSFKFYAK